MQSISVFLDITKFADIRLKNADVSRRQGFFSKCDQIHSFLRIWLHSLKKSFMENFIFCAV